jgi:hypothetical protein
MVSACGEAMVNDDPVLTSTTVAVKVWLLDRR